MHWVWCGKDVIAVPRHLQKFWRKSAEKKCRQLENHWRSNTWNWEKDKHFHTFGWNFLFALSLCPFLFFNESLECFACLSLNECVNCIQCMSEMKTKLCNIWGDFGRKADQLFWSFFFRMSNSTSQSLAYVLHTKNLWKHVNLSIASPPNQIGRRNKQKQKKKTKLDCFSQKKKTEKKKWRKLKR